MTCVNGGIIILRGAPNYASISPTTPATVDFKFNTSIRLLIKFNATNLSYLVQIVVVLKAMSLELTLVHLPPSLMVMQLFLTLLTLVRYVRTNYCLFLSLALMMEKTTQICPPWTFLEMFGLHFHICINRSCSHIMYLKKRFTSISKGTSFIVDYLHSLKSIVDELVLIDRYL